MESKSNLSYLSATGKIEYNMTNNYMFRYILQENEKVLKGLVSSLLHLNPENIKTIEIKNPIDLSGDVTGKEFILDIKVMLNDDTLINLEMRKNGKELWVRAFLVVERDSQKGMVIGKGASMIKTIRVESIKEMRKIFDYRVDLDLQVKVNKNWRQKDPVLARLLK